MKKQTILNKITPEVRKMIHDHTMTLPQVPFFIMGKTGMVPQRIAIGKRISGEQLKEEGGKVSGGGEIDIKGSYVQRGTKIRMMNHKVTLTQQYQKLGQKGIDDYVAYVKQMAIMIEQMKNQKPKGIKSAGQPTPISEEEGKDIMEAEAADKAIIKDGAPKAEDFGYVYHDESGQESKTNSGEWTVEGGEEAYHKALAEYEEMNELK